MPADLPIADARQRQEALDISRSFCVMAPAGSGKTELLTQRILKLLAVSEEPENLLAITFTRKAAAEMRQRLLDTLFRARDCRDLDGLPAHEKLTLRLGQKVLTRNEERDWQLLQNPGRLQLTTIDSFNLSLASQLPLLSGFGARPEIEQDPQALYAEAVIALLEKLEGSSPLADDLALVLSHLDNNILKIESLLCQLLGKRDQWLEHILHFQQRGQQDDDDSAIRRHLESTLCAVIEDTLTKAQASFGHLLPELMEDLVFARRQLLRLDAEHPLSNADKAFIEQAATPSACIADLPVWQALASLLLTKDGVLRKSVDKRAGFPADGANASEKAEFKQRKSAFLERLQLLTDSPGASEALVHIQLLPPAGFGTQQWQILSALTRVLFHLVGELQLVFQTHNCCDYVQVSAAALQALGDDEHPTAIALRLDYQIQHILVDEFQDTSSLQMRLLERLTRGWDSSDGRTLFIVGDGMQSCYGFRNANVGLFLAARDQGIGQVQLVPLQLEVNFRSELAVVDWVNTVFQRAFPARDDIGRGAVAYTQATALHRRNTDAGIDTLVFRHAFNEEGPLPDKKYMARLEAERVADIISRLQHSEPQASIAILVKNRPHIRAILPVLRQNNIAWNAAEIDPLDSYMEIQDLMSLCRALLDPADTTAWLAVLRAPFVGLSLQDIHCLSRFAAVNELTLCQALEQFDACTGLSAEGLAILQRVVPVLMHARRQRQTVNIRDWLEHCWLALGGPACMGPEIDASHVEDFFTLLAQESTAEDIPDMAHFARKLGAHHVNSKVQAGVNLQIMTIHKAKGLEFDYVILPRLNSGGRTDDTALLQWQEYISDSAPGAGLILSIPERRGNERDPLHRYLREERKERSALEDTRVLYIGITRAIRKAWLLASVNTSARGEMRVNSGSLLSRIWEAVEPVASLIEVSNEATDSTVTSAADSSPLLYGRRLPPHWKHPQPTALPISSGRSEENTALPGLVHNQAERVRGDIVHYCLKLVAEGRLELNDRARLDSLATHWQSRLAACSAQPQEHVKLILEQLAMITASETAAWLLSPAHEESACELSLSDYRANWRRELIIDRSFIEEGLRWVVDYKSSLPASGQSREAFLAQEEERYRPQLEAYSEIMQVFDPLHPVRPALYFTGLDLLYPIGLHRQS